jgi:single-strand selective monofunctional uracil DNA glycosylase
LFVGAVSPIIAFRLQIAIDWKGKAAAMDAREDGRIIRVSADLRDAVDGLSFAPPVAFVYHPLAYAWEPHRAYLAHFGARRGTPREALFLGMNPGPWGMAQTGVPFGDVGMVRDWMGIGGRVDRPLREHPGRPVTGFACRRGEGSGRRLWGWARDRFGSPEAFFSRFFVANYCPLAFFDKEGANLTPDKLPPAMRMLLMRACDDALRRTVELLDAPLVIGVGKWAEARAREALAGLPVRVGSILHPSPASPAANRGWARQAEEQLAALGVSLEPGRETR